MSLKKSNSPNNSLNTNSTDCAEPQKPKGVFDMKIFLDRMIEKCDDLNNFPLRISKRTCNHVSLILQELNFAAEKAKNGDPSELEAQKAKLGFTLFQLEE